ncbi:MAG TPA: membrane protein insertase YidC [Terracidiphilus sp.]|nr:membrane protein insertase YidC [Terracidiphilus sp.]
MPEIHNPNLQSQGAGGRGGSGGDLSSTMMFMLLALMLFMGYEYFFKPKTEPHPEEQTQTQTRHAGQNQAQVHTAAAAHGGATAAQPSIVAATQADVTVENELYKIVLSNRGGEIEHWILKKYTDSEGKPLDMVQPEMAARFGLPLSFFTYDSSLTSQLNQALYQVTVKGARTANGALLAPASVTFRYAANGLDVVKSIYFNSTYVIAVDTEVKQDGAPVRALLGWPAGLGDMEEFRPTFHGAVFTSASSQFAWSLNGKQDSTKAAKVSGDATLNEPYSYAAVADLYFAAAFLPYNPDHTTVVTLHHEVELPANPGNPNGEKKPAQVLGMAMGDTTGATHLRLFAGPKETDVLSSIHAVGADNKFTGQSLAPLIHFGVFSIVAKPLYLAVRFLRSRLGPGEYNWGWAIVIVGLLLNLVTLPSRLMMTRSSLKMMRIQPKVDVIKRKYSGLKATDPKRAEMNTEMMALYKEEGVNMYGGCLPMIIQMPLLWAIYEVLENAIELRQAHWFWIPDLSSPDPTYVLPALFILTMFLVQYISPSPGMDPAQRRMMAFVMPVIFGFTLFHFPSGLALYWFVGNLINLAIQIGINRSSIGKEMHAIAARRAAKKSGGLRGQQGRR